MSQNPFYQQPAMNEYNINCPACSQTFSVVDEYAGQQTQCPECQSYFTVPARAVQSVLRTVPPSAAIPTGSQGLARAHRGQNRRMLIFGGMALLVLGGLGIFLASKNSGNTYNTVKNTRNEIINNSYFQELIASGATTENALLRMEMIFPHEDGFIGLSGNPLTWDEAQDLARQTASEILPFDSSDASSNREILRRIAPSADGGSFWVSVQGVSAILSEEGTTPISPPSGPTHWLFQGPPAESKLLAASQEHPVLPCS